jgi:hypothetical protein
VPKKRDFAGEMVKGHRRAVEGGTQTKTLTSISLCALMLLDDARKRAVEGMGDCGLVLSPSRTYKGGYVMRRRGGKGGCIVCTTYRFQMHVLLVAPSKVARLPLRLRRSGAAHFQSDALDGVAAGIAVVEVEGREHDGRGGRVHQRVRNIIRMRHVMRAQVEVDDAVTGKVSLGG